VRLLFWLALLLIAYAYIGYALLLRLMAGVRSRPYKRLPITPRVSIVMAAHNEEKNLPAKLANLAALQYPPELIEIVVASDASTDATEEILQSAGKAIVPVILKQQKGKASALNQAVKHATGEIIVFFDTRQMVDSNSVPELISCFADPEIGAVSGELLLVDAKGRATGDALGLYWRIEKMVRKLESATGSVVGVTGAIYALRKELFVELPEGTLLDDVLIPMNAVRGGKRVIFLPTAVARDRIFPNPATEFRRKVRTLTGNYQLLRTAPWLLTISNPLLFRFVSHKLMRLLVPFLLVLLLLASSVAKGWIYRASFVGQLIFYGLAILGWLSPGMRRSRIIGIAWTFTMLNFAAVLALYNFLTGQTEVWGLIRG
jgi:poly-beta-1,6-N-acetyl-D-glucosamine synthase